MNKKIHFFLLTSLVVLVMIVSAVQPMVVRADDSTPPPAPAAPASGDTSAPAAAASSQAPAADTSAPASNDTQAPAADTSAAADSAASADTSVAPADASGTSADNAVAPADTSAAPADTIVAPTDPSTLVGSVPTGTSVVVLDDTGNPIPLATQQAANVLSTGDPYFTITTLVTTTYGFTSAASCPANVTNCVTTNSSTPIQDAIDYLSKTLHSVPDDHNIYVEAGSYTEDVTVDGTSWGLGLTPSNLGLIGAGSTGGPGSSTTLNGFLSISNMNAFALQGFAITGSSANGTYVSADNNTGMLYIADVRVKNTTANNNGNGISVTNHKGRIYLGNVASNDNRGAGASLDDTSCISNCYVSFSGANFLRNGSDGLDVSSSGMITLSEVVAANNGTSGTGSGAVLSTTSASSSSVVLYDGGIGNQFNNNASTGLHVNSNGGITLNGVTASGNKGGDGAYINNPGSSVTIDPGVFDYNQNNGLFIMSGGVTLSGVDASHNISGLGAFIVSGPVTINPASTFDYNRQDGLNIQSTGDVVLSGVDVSGTVAGNGASIQNSGAVNLSYVTASGNVGYGVFINNTTGSGDVTIDPGAFDGNTAGDGLHILSNGDITFSNVTADGNTGGSGAYIQNTSGSIIIDPGSFDGNLSNGLFILSGGDLTLSNVDASGNILGNGAFINNSGWVTINPTSTFDYNQQDGLNIMSTGDVMLTGVDASSNKGGNGVSVQNSGDVNLFDVTASGNVGDGVFINNTTGSGDVTIDPGAFDGNTAGDGLHILSNGAITLSNVTADGNTGGSGAYIQNTSGSIIIDPGSFDGNLSNGLFILSGGDLTLSNVDASGNILGNGAFINNSGWVTIDPGTFDANLQDGLNIMSTGDVMLTGVDANSNKGGNGVSVQNSGNVNLFDVTASGNVGNGVSINNSTGSGYVAVDNSGISGGDGFNTNSLTGLVVNSMGDIVLENVSAQGNDPIHSGTGYGVYLNNSYVGSLGTISIDPDGGASLFNGNGAMGLSANSMKDITLWNVTADANGSNTADDGVYLDNLGVSYLGDGTISVTNSTFDGNTGKGLGAYSNSNITLTQVTADNNKGEAGAYLGATHNFAGNGTIEVNNADGGEFNGNTGNGLEAYAKNDITFTDVIADANGGSGALLNNTFGSGSISVDPSTFNNNLGGDGLSILSNADVTLTDVTASTNAGNGVTIDNTTGSGTILVTSSTLNSNLGNMSPGAGGRGLVAHSNGDITLVDVTASQNADGGAELNNTFGSGAILLTGNNTFDGNGFNLTPSVGLYTVSNGDIDLSGVTALGNGYGLGGGAFVETGGDLSITNSVFNDNCTECSLGFGFIAFSDGDASLDGVTADGNGNNSGAASALGAEIITGGNLTITNSDFSENCTLGACAGAGIEVLSGTGGLIYFDHVTANGNGTTPDSDGAFLLSTGDDIAINCSTFNNNSGFGLGADLSGGNTITLDGVTLNGNASGATDITGGTVVHHTGNCGSNGSSGGSHVAAPINIIPVTGLPIHTIDVTGGEDNPLDCTNYSGTDLVLPNGDHALLPCPIGTSGSLSGVKNDELPGTLDGKFSFASGFKVEVAPSLTGSMTVSFKVPSGKEGSKFAILHWDGTKWVNLGGSANPPGYFSVDTNLGGDFVLVTQ